MPNTVISVENLSKQYRLGLIGGATFREEFGRWWARRLGRPDPWTKVGQTDHGNRQGEYVWALQEVSFAVQEGDIVGIIGRNGAGKSTLLKILSRIVSPTSGCIKIRGRVASLLEVGTGFHQELTGRENIFLNGAILGMTRTEIQRKMDEIIAFSEIERYIDTPVKRYSSGMTVRLAFAVAAHLDPEILVVDEVLAVGDYAFQLKCLGKMGEISQSGRTVLFVSHNLDSVRRLCRSGVVLSRGQLAYTGGVDEAVNHYLRLHEGHREAGVIVLDGPSRKGYDIPEVLTLDADGRPLPKLHTWDAVRLRIVFDCPNDAVRGAVALQVSDLSGSVLHYCSTRPDRNVPVLFHAGRNQIDCCFPRLRLAAGRYRIGAGLALEGGGWIIDKRDSGILEVFERDVYASGQAPNSTRYAIADDYEWVQEG